MNSVQKTFNENFEWQIQFEKEFTRIANQHLKGRESFKRSTLREDMHENADLILRPESFRVACRVRRIDKNYNDYKNQVTIRLPELKGVIDGLGDVLIYGFGDEDSGKLDTWTIVDLKKFQQYFKTEYKNTGNWVGIYNKANNEEGVTKKVCHRMNSSNDFLVFELSYLNDRDMILAASWKTGLVSRYGGM